jgi:hypothetical protein
MKISDARPPNVWRISDLEVIKNDLDRKTGSRSLLNERLGSQLHDWQARIY